MAKHPDKFMKEKEFHKEIIKDKLEKEHKEHKEKPEIKEKPEKELKDFIKEHKDKPEKEIKEISKDKPEKEIKEISKEITKEDKDIKEVKEVKEVEKPIKEKDKDAEFPGGGGDPVFQPQAASQFKFKDHLEKIHVDKVHKDKDHEFPAQAAAQPQAAAQAKLTDKVIEKTHKDIEKIIKDKDFKAEKHEKFEIKEWKDIKEWDVAGPGHVGPGDPVEQRVAALEATLTQLLHFIPQELRPDLSTGALSAEKRAQTGTAAKKSKRAAGTKKAKSEKQ